MEAGEALGGARRILIVDDRPELLSFLVRRLARDGLEAVVCQEPAAALLEFEKGACAAALVDLYFGESPAGWDLVAAMRRSVMGGRVPIVSMSGSAPEELARCLEMGADAVLGKPFTYDELRDAIERAEGARSGSNPR